MIPGNNVPSPDTVLRAINELYDFDYNNQVIANNKYDAKRTYKKNQGYVPGIATIGDEIVYVENTCLFHS